MGRAERPLDPDAGPLARFAGDLRNLRRAAGSPTYRTLARQTHYSVTTLSQAAAGTSLPSLAVTLSYAEACGGDRERWRQRWQEVAALLAADQAAHRTPATVEADTRTPTRVEADTSAPGIPHRPSGVRPSLVRSSRVRPSRVRKLMMAAVNTAVTRRGTIHEHSVTADGIRQDHVVPRQLPATTSHFTGRADELKQLAGMAGGSGTSAVSSAITVISGTAGVGKTTLAVHWAHQVAEYFPDGQLHVDLRGFDPAGSPVPPGQAIRGFLGALGVPAVQIPGSQEEQASLYRSLLAGKRFLVVLDNARDEQQVRPLLPGGPGSMTVVTSRNPLAGLVASHGAQSITLDVLTDGEARDLLARRLGSERLAAEPTAVAELIGHCANLPLALAIIAARAETSSRLPLAGLAAELRDSRRRLDTLDMADITVSVRHVFGSSYDALSGEAGRMFRLLGIGPGPEVSVPAAASLSGCGQARARVMLGELTRAHLLTEYAPGRYVFHDLLRAYAAELALACDSDRTRRAALDRLLSYLLHAAAGAALRLHPQRRPVTLAPLRPGAESEVFDDDAQALTWLELEYEVLLAAIGRAEREGLDVYVWQLPWALADLFYQGRWHDWARVQRSAAAAAQRSGDCAGQALALRALGQATATAAGDYDLARAYFSGALDRYRDLGDQAGQAQLHGDLCVMYGLQDKHAEALRHASAALSIARDAGLPEQAYALNSIGWCHAQLGDYPEALASCQQALALHRESGSTFGEATTLDSIGYTYQHMGDHTKAIDHYQQAADLQARLGARWQLSETLTRLGDSHLAAGDQAATASAWGRALAILEDLHHPSAAGLRDKLRDLQLPPVAASLTEHNERERAASSQDFVRHCLFTAHPAIPHRSRMCTNRAVWSMITFPGRNHAQATLADGGDRSQCRADP